MSIFVIITSLTFVSCESDSTDDPSNDNNPGNTSNVLITKVIETDSNGDAITSECFYNGNKLNYILDDNSGTPVKTVFIYTNNLITSTNLYVDNVLTIKDEYTYDSNSRLIEHKQYDFTGSGTINHEYKFTFIYNSNNTINFELYSTSPSMGTDLEKSGVINLDANQNVTSNTVTDEITSETTTYTYTYDTKNNPIKNIVGMEKIRYAWPSGEIEGSILNNVLNVSVDGNTNSTTYTYNALNFPATSSYSENGETYNTQYFYNQ